MKSTLTPMPLSKSQPQRKSDRIVEYALFAVAALLTVVWLTTT